MHALSILCRTMFGVGFLATAVSTLSSQCQLQWQPGSEQSATNGSVFAVVADPASPRVYAGGIFSVAGSAFCSSVAMWDGTSWQPLDAGVDGSVSRMLLLPNGDLIVAGQFGEAGGVPVGNIARWDGTQWSAIGAGFDQSVSALIQLPNGDLAVGGSFSASGTQLLESLAVWNGTAWLPYAGPGLSGDVTDMVLLSSGELVVSGTLVVPGQAGQQALAIWDGASWDSIALAAPGLVFDLAALPNGELAMSGPYISNTGFAVWDGQSVQPEATPLTAAVRGMVVDDSGDLIVAGSSATQPGMVARRSNGVWTTLLDEVGIGFSVDVANGQIVVGGTASVATRPLPSVLSFDGSSWQPVGAPTNAAVTALAAGPEDRVFAGGNFSVIEGVAANNVAVWDGTSWQAMGTGVGGPVLQVEVTPSGDAIVVGRFANAGGAPVNRIARWNGSNWSSLGAGITSATIGDLAVGPDGEVVLVTGAGVEVYESGAWTVLPLPAPFLQIGDCEVLPNGDIVVAGFFLPEPGVKRWDGTAWVPYGSAPISGALALDAEGRLYRAPPVGHSGHIQRFDGNSWTDLGGVVTGYVDAITPLAGERVVITGTFSSIDGQPFERSALWNGTNWIELDGGLSGFAGNAVHDAITTTSGALWMASDYSVVGGEISPGLARALPTCPASSATFGAGCVGAAGPLTLAAKTLPWIGSTVRARAEGLPSNSLAAHVLGTTPLLAPLPTPGCSLFVDPILVDAMLPTAGAVEPEFDVPDDPTLVGILVRSQIVGLELSAGLSLQGVTSSNALDHTIGAY